MNEDDRMLLEDLRAGHSIYKDTAEEAERFLRLARAGEIPAQLMAGLTGVWIDPPKRNLN